MLGSMYLTFSNGSAWSTFLMLQTDLLQSHQVIRQLTAPFIYCSVGALRQNTHFIVLYVKEQICQLICVNQDILRNTSNVPNPVSLAFLVIYAYICSCTLRQHPIRKQTPIWIKSNSISEHKTPLKKYFIDILN